MAFLTRSELIRPLAARLLMRAALLEPELRHAIVRAPRPALPPMSLTVLIRHNVTAIFARSPRRAFHATFAIILDSGSRWSCGDAVGPQALMVWRGCSHRYLTLPRASRARFKECTIIMTWRPPRVSTPRNLCRVSRESPRMRTRTEHKVMGRCHLNQGRLHLVN